MTLIQECLKNNQVKNKPIWLMRQAGRYLPEFREIRSKNLNFIELCLNKKLSSEITLQPLKRFDFDAAIIFSDILMLPYGIGQDVEFKKNIGPILKDLNIDDILKINENSFKEKLNPVYEAINLVKNNKLVDNKDVIGFVGAPWTLLVYMLNKKSPKKDLNRDLLKNKKRIDKLLKIILKFLKIHIENQVKSGASIIQIFDSWAGLVEENDLDKYIYSPTLELVNFTKLLNVPVLCFPRNIKNYKNFTQIVKPDGISIDYNVDPKVIINDIKIPVQGGLDPKILLSGKEELRKQALKYLDIFKDHPYIFNLGHGVIPETDPNMVDYLVKLVKDY
ncbi:MAG: uroporphyrinogen decarboxylase [Candidatus Pelagibacter sp.]|nr:uroporphyrinogen decarboxylase [Candidatus Pelagibacter sp.]